MVTLKRFIVLFILTLTACSGITPTSSVTPSPLPPTETALPPTATPLPMAVKVNADGITVTEFNEELARYKASMTALGKTVTDQDAAKTVQDDLIAQLLLSQGAEEAGFVMDDGALQQRLDALITKLGDANKLADWEKANNYTHDGFKLALKRAAASAWMRDKIISTVPPTTEQVHIRQILLYNADVAANVHARLENGTDFDELAAQVDIVTHGDLGWFPRGYLPEKNVEDAAFSLEVGKYSQVIPGDTGFHILKLMEKQPDHALSPDALAVLQTRAVSDWLDIRRKMSSIVLTP